MKGTLRFIPALAVMLAAVLSLGVCASADALPRETVGFDYSRQEAAAVPANDLTEDDLTLNGISFKARIEDGKVHILIVDLAAANLLRDNAALAAELGLDYDDFYIENGQIFIKTTGRTAAQIAAIQAKLDALMAQSAPVGVSVGDEYILASGGVDRVVVAVSELVSGGDTSAPMPETAADVPPAEDHVPPAEEPTVEKPTLDVKGIRYSSDKKLYLDSDDHPVSSDVRPAVTTVYFRYRNAETFYIASAEGGTSTGYEYTTDSTRYIGSTNANIGLVRSEDDENEYYISFRYGDTVTESTLFKDNNSLDELLKSVKNSTSVVKKEGSRSIGEMADEIYISIRSDGQDVVVKTIRLNDVTPAAKDFFTGNLPPSSGSAPDGYVFDSVPSGKYDKGFTRADGNKSGTPEYGHAYKPGDKNDPDGINYISRIDDPTGEETTISIRNNVRLITEAEVDKTALAATSAPDGETETVVETAQVTDAVELTAVEPVAESAADIVTEIAPDMADFPVETGAEINAEADAADLG